MKDITKLTILLFLIILLFTGCKKAVTTKDVNDVSGKGPSVGDVEVVAKGFEGADGVVVDYLGNIYVGNRHSNILSKVNPKGEVVDFVEVPCQELLCMTVDKENNIYAAGKDKVFKIDHEGNIKVLASDFTCADDVRLDLEGNLYVTDSFENIVYKITPEFEKSIYIDNILKEQVSIGTWHITGITFDNEYKNLYIARMRKGEIVKYPIRSDKTAGKPEIIADGLPEPDHLEIDSEGNIYVTLFREGSLLKITPEGKVENISTNQFGYATGVAFGKENFNEEYLFIADYGENMLCKVYVGKSAVNHIKR